MADLLSAALIERGERALVAHRRTPPLAGRWTLPATAVGEHETAEEAVRRHAREQFGLLPASETFVDTLYVVDPADQRQYVANIFRTALEGPIRFNAEGDYDDARWLGPAEIEQLDTMPPDLRLQLVKLLTDPESAQPMDWERFADDVSAQQAVPLAEQQAAEPAEPTPPPDNKAAWDAIAKAYQEERFGDRFGERLMWSWRASEDDLHVLDDVRGMRALVLGCGGGQDVVALVKLGAVATGVDISPAQLAYARKYAAARGAENASFVEGDVQDLSRFDDESFDLAISIHALGHVENVAAVMAEAARVLKPGGVLAVAVQHPFDACVDGPPYRVTTPYWTRERDWTWEFKDGSAGSFRAYRRTVGEWFELLTNAGFAVERVVEPQEGDIPKAPDDDHDDNRLRLMPYTLIIKARKR
ncbi:MAG TPA: methyltransferase domain-containing protein [Dehalococcoidia bacterium]|nr:methyltransferase domain-containing protein [Dehalococcoidia bacterium]